MALMSECWVTAFPHQCHTSDPVGFRLQPVSPCPWMKMKNALHIQSKNGSDPSFAGEYLFHTYKMQWSKVTHSCTYLVGKGRREQQRTLGVIVKEAELPCKESLGGRVCSKLCTAFEKCTSNTSAHTRPDRHASHPSPGCSLLSLSDMCEGSSRSFNDVCWCVFVCISHTYYSCAP